MKVKFPLYLQTIGFLVLHLLVLAMLFLLFFNTQFGLGWEALISSPLGERVEGISWVIRQQMLARPRESWNDVLAGFDKLYGVKFSVFDRRGNQIAGEPVSLPDSVLQRVTRRHSTGQAEPVRGAAPLILPGPKEAAAPPRDHFMHRFLLHTSQPSCFWVGVRFGIPAGAQDTDVLPHTDLPPMIPGTLIAACPNLFYSRLFFDLWALASVVGGIFVLSILIWWPFVYSITKAMAEVTAMTERIAEGRFDARLQVSRSDEIGRLAGAVNSMAERLENFVAGQKRFLGDTAHELCSPVSRLLIALELLETSVSEQQESTLKDIREDVEEMSHLINELLAFSKAGIQGIEIRLVPVNIGAVLKTAMLKTASENLLRMDVPADVSVHGDQLLLERAFGNVIRNAVRYASQDGPIEVKVCRAGQEVIVTVTDCGPGVPAEALKLLGQPFFRPEPSRSRSSGGVGLGLAIVKTCVESCGGTFKIRNHQPKGLQVEVRLRAHVSAEANANMLKVNAAAEIA